MKQEVILVLDCGATNVRAIAVDRQGNIVARAATPNASELATENTAWHQWSLEAILQRFADCCQTLSAQLSICLIRGITVTTFGVDGALVDEHGKLLYPIISWKCPRTAAVMNNIGHMMTPQRLQEISGSAHSASTHCINSCGSRRIILTCLNRLMPGCLFHP